MKGLSSVLAYGVYRTKVPGERRATIRPFLFLSVVILS